MEWMNRKNWWFHKTSILKTTLSQSPRNWFVEWSHHRVLCLCALPSQFRTHHCALIAELIASHQIVCLRSCVSVRSTSYCAGCWVQSSEHCSQRCQSQGREGRQPAIMDGDAEKENKISKCSTDWTIGLEVQRWHFLYRKEL